MSRAAVEIVWSVQIRFAGDADGLGVGLDPLKGDADLSFVSSQARGFIPGGVELCHEDREGVELQVWGDRIGTTPHLRVTLGRRVLFEGVWPESPAGGPPPARCQKTAETCDFPACECWKIMTPEERYSEEHLVPRIGLLRRWIEAEQPAERRVKFLLILGRVLLKQLDDPLGAMKEQRRALSILGELPVGDGIQGLLSLAVAALAETFDRLGWAEDAEELRAL